MSGGWSRFTRGAGQGTGCIDSLLFALGTTLIIMAILLVVFWKMGLVT